MSNLLKIFAILPILTKQGETKGRHGFQVMFTPQSDPDTLSVERKGSRNVWDGYVGKGQISDIDLAFRPDPLFTAILNKVSLPNDFWDKTYTETPKELNKVLGMTVEGELCTEFVEPYEVPGQSVDSRRVQYTTIVLKGENKFAIFSQQGHPIVRGERLKQIEEIASEIALANLKGREDRRAKRNLTENVGTGALTRMISSVRTSSEELVDTDKE